MTLDRDVLEHLRRTAHGRSRSERANELLRRAIQLEQREQLAVEAEQFFAGGPKAARRETGAWQRLARATWDRE